MAAAAVSLHDRPARKPLRALRPAILLLVLSLHAAFLLLAVRWQARLELRNVESLMLLALPSQQIDATSGAEPVVPHQQLELPLDIQLITLPIPEVPIPAETPPEPTVDWNAQAALTAKHQAQLAAEPKPRALDQSSGGMYIIGSGFEAQRPEFGWDHARTHRFEGLEGGGSLLWLNDRCFMAVTALIPFPICGTGKMTVRGDLFDQLDQPKPEPRANTAP